MFSDFKKLLQLKSYLKKLEQRTSDLELRMTLTERALEHHIETPRFDIENNRAFNGQEFRQKIFLSSLSAFTPERIIETGTFMGDTTGYLANTSRKPVTTCESNRLFFLLAKKRLEHVAQIDAHLNDTVGFLHKLAESSSTDLPTLFYLDAHWEHHLPLREEIDLIANKWSKYLILIDDFQVPHDDGYGYDDYGGEACLRLAYIRDLCQGTYHCFPAIESQQETGARRGCVLITNETLPKITYCTPWQSL